MQAAVLKAIVKQVQLAEKLLFRQKAGLIPVSANDHGCLQLARDQQGLIAELGGRTIRIDNSDLIGTPSIAAGKNVEGDTAFRKQLTQSNHEGRLAAATDGNVANAHHRPCQFLYLKNAAIIQSVSYCNAGGEKGGEWVHRARSCCCKNGARASIVRRVAPSCLANKSFARRPMRWRSSEEPSNERNTEPRLSAVTVFTAPPCSAIPCSKMLTISRKLNVCGPTRMAAPYCAGSRILWPPMGTRLPPTKAMSASS